MKRLGSWRTVGLGGLRRAEPLMLLRWLRDLGAIHSIVAKRNPPSGGRIPHLARAKFVDIMFYHIGTGSNLTFIRQYASNTPLLSQAKLLLHIGEST
jgi:hypothetical protein